MAKAKRSKQLSFTMSNKVGLLSEISTAISDAKVNITALSACEIDDKAYFMFITDSNTKAKKALSKFGAEIREEDILTVEMPNRVGELKKMADKIAQAGININYLYGTTGAAKTAICVLKTVDNKKAIRVINK